ncbi:MAG: methyltransferase domain-containing protein, partial [Betaproteobacteria bacterium]
VVDIGCGGGPTSLRIAEIVGPSGLVMGVDVAPQLVRLAQQRAAAADRNNAHFFAADMRDAVGRGCRSSPDSRFFGYLTGKLQFR